MGWFKYARVPPFSYENYEFVPQKDITTYELALIYKNVGGLGNHEFVKFPVGKWEQVPPGVKRHFRRAG